MINSSTILAVDDDDMNLEMLDVMLSSSDIRVIKAGDGLQAIKMLEENPEVDVMLVDLEMPVMDGFKFISFAKQSIQFCEIPIVVLSGNCGEVTSTLAMGASDFIAKPFKREELQLRVMNQIRIKKASDLAKNKLRKSEARLEQLLQSTDQGVYSITMDGCCSFINKPGLTLLGLKTEDCIGENIHNLIHRCHPDGAVYPVEDCPAHKALMTGTTYLSENELLWRKDGTSFPADFSINPLVDNGIVSGAVVTFSDITRRRKAEEEKFILNRAIEQCPVSIVITDVHGTMEFCNPKFSELTGYSAEEAVGQNPRILKSGGTPPSTYEELWAAITTSGEWEGEFLNTSKDGKLFWERAVISSIRDSNGKISHYVAVKEDITEKKRMLEQLTTAKKQAEAANVAKTSFLATMSHEIRTPMNGVIGMIGMLLESDLSETQKEYAEIVQTSSENLLTIINEILDFSKIEAGKMELEILDFDLRVTLEDVAEMLSLRAENSGLELICSIDPSIPFYLKGDPGRLRQILLNLAGNAIKFTKKGEVVISATLQSDNDGIATILFEVRDSGIGIPESRLAAIFEPFTQADGSTTRTYGGTGLGLSISKQLTDLMGGKFGVTSREGEGSTFWFSVSFEKQADQGVRVVKKSGYLERSDITKARILVVDDNVTNRKLMKTLLSYWGCRFEIAADGDEGLMLMRKAVAIDDPFRIALLDQEMPGMDGMELGQLIKADPQLASTLMIMVTSLARRGDIAVMNQIGFTGYLGKPVRQIQLYNCLELALNRDAAPQGDFDQKQSQGIITRHTLERPGREKVRLLLAEDNAINQKVAKHMLKSLGYNTDVVGNGIEAVKALEMINYDLVFMDCKMPVMDGFQATAAIRDIGSRVLNHEVPIIALTANATQGDEAMCLEAGMSDYLSKPVKIVAMSKVIDKWLKNNGAE